jgi:hypothetical protein
MHVGMYACILSHLSKGLDVSLVIKSVQFASYALEHLLIPKSESKSYTNTVAAILLSQCCGSHVCA